MIAGPIGSIGISGRGETVLAGNLNPTRRLVNGTNNERPTKINQRRRFIGLLKRFHLRSKRKVHAVRIIARIHSSGLCGSAIEGGELRSEIMTDMSAPPRQTRIG